MKREIKFRGKRLDNGEWVEGTPVWSINNRCYMIIGAEEAEQIYFLCQVKYVEVDPETVGQWTGLIDKFGAKIYEGDIMVNQFIYTHFKYEILYSRRVSAYIIRNTYDAGDNATLLLESDLHRYGRYIIGNIHDNPDLLKTE